MHDDLEAGGLDDVVKGAGAGNVGHEDRREAVPGKARVGLVDLVGLVLRAHGGDDRVAAGEERLEDVCCLLLLVNINASSEGKVKVCSEQVLTGDEAGTAWIVKVLICIVCSTGHMRTNR